VEVPGHSYPCLAEARWWFVAHRLYQLGAYVNPVYTVIWVGFPLPMPRHCCIPPFVVLLIISVERTSPLVPAKKPDRQFNVGDKVRVNLHDGKIEDAVARAVIKHTDGIKLLVDVIGIDLTALVDTKKVVKE